MTDQTLEGYVADSTVGDLATLAFLTGVEHQLLVRVSGGRSTPDVAHVAAIRRVLPDVPDDLLYGHRRPAPELVSTKRGTTPDGTTLTTVRTTDLRPGDLIPYQPQQYGNGSQWVAVDGEVVVEGMFVTASVGGEVLRLNINQIVKVARPA